MVQNRNSIPTRSRGRVQPILFRNYHTLRSQEVLFRPRNFSFGQIARASKRWTALGPPSVSCVIWHVRQAKDGWRRCMPKKSGGGDTQKRPVAGSRQGNTGESWSMRVAAAAIGLVSIALAFYFQAGDARRGRKGGGGRVDHPPPSWYDGCLEKPEEWLNPHPSVPPLSAFSAEHNASLLWGTYRPGLCAAQPGPLRSHAPI